MRSAVDEVHLLGIRHHGPGSARAVRLALDQLRPDAVLVELPADATPLLRWVADEGLVPPVALLAHVVDQPRRAAFAPLAVFSPEWQAVRWALTHGVEPVAIDLPWSTVLAHEAQRPTDGDPAAARPDPPPADVDRRGLQPDELVREPSLDPLGALAAAAGEPDPERWWEDVVEHRDDGASTFAAVAEAMDALREGHEPSSFEARREAHMRRAIRAAQRAGHGRIAVVCGAWHVPALHVERSTSTADQRTLRSLPRAKVAVSWVPWTHRRLAAASGYGAGVRSPGWYGHVFEHPGDESVPNFVVAAARRLREAGLAASPDHLIAASRLADALAALRDRPRSGLDEITDAIDAVMGGLPLVRERLVIGTGIGVVPSAAPQAPLVRDVAAAQRRARLPPSAEARDVELDLRTPNGRRRSHLLHRLAALGVGWGTLQAGRGSSGTFRETWRVVWEPELSVRLVELTGYGTTLVDAAASRLVERAAQASTLVEVAAAVDQALAGDLPSAVDPLLGELARRAAHDPDVVHLARALGPLVRAARYGDVRATDARSLRRVVDDVVVRVLAGLDGACASLDDDAASVMVDTLSELQSALATIDHPARRDDLPRALESVVRARTHGLVRGRATRLLHDLGHWSPTEVRRRLGRALGPGAMPAEGAAYVEGLLAGSGTLLVHDDVLRGAVDQWLASLHGEAFVEVVPLLRRTFGSFEPAERRQLGQLVAGGVRSAPPGFGPGVDARRAAAALRTVRVLTGLPVGDPVDGVADLDGPHHVDDLVERDRG